MRYSIVHMFAAIALVAIALCLRASWISFENDGFSLVATVIIAIITGAYAGWFRARLIIVLFASLGAAVILSSVLSLERVFHSPDAMFPRSRIDTFYFDDPQLNFITVVVHSAIATVFGTLVGYFVARFHDWLSVNSVSLGIVFAVSLVCGYSGYHFGGLAFPHVPSSRLSVFSGVLGVIFGVAWVSSYRSFPETVNDKSNAG